MVTKYYFGIKNSRVGPLDEKAIAVHIKEGSITPETLSWCDGMAQWQPLRQIPELMTAFSVLFKNQAEPPPLPADHTVPPLPGSGSTAATSSSGSLSDQAYRFIVWCYRPWKGKYSPLRRFVDADPKARALPVAAGTIAMMILIIVLAVGTFTAKKDTTQQQLGFPQMMQQQGGGPSMSDLMARQRAWQSAQDYTSDVIDDAYKYRRDTQDRMDETYRRATYAWYNDDND
jgi:hypothetical protein